MAGIAAVVTIALIVWLVVSVTGPAPSPPPVSSSPPQSPSEGSTPSVEATWGEYPPVNLDSLRDLSEATFPAEVLSRGLVSEDASSVSVIANYEDALVAQLDFSAANYKRSMARLQDVAFIGRAACGNPTTHPDQTACFMAGTSETLRVLSASTSLTTEDVAAFTEALYDSL